MENTIIENTNQLSLFELLSADQELKKITHQKFKKDLCNRAEAKAKHTIELLKNNGFTDNEFLYSFNKHKTTEKINVNKWNEPEKIVECEVDYFNCSLYLLFDYFDKDKNQIIKRKVYFWVDKSKIECSTLTGNYRYYKVSSILNKIKESSTHAQFAYESHNRKQTIIEYTVDKYKKLYPEAIIKSGKDFKKLYKGNYVEYNKITIEFKSGSYIVLEPTSERDKECLIEKHDAVMKKLSLIETMNYFNSQQAR